MNLKSVIKIIMICMLYNICMILFNGVEAADISDGVYTIKSAVSDSYVVDVTGVSTENCANIELWQNNNGKNQQFEFKKVDGKYYTIKAVNSGKYLDVENASKSNGANIIQYDYHGGDNQKWEIRKTLDGYYYFVSKISGLCIDIAGARIANGSNILTYTFHYGANQKFKLECVGNNSITDGLYKIVSTKNQNYVLDVTGVSTNNCANIEIWADNGGTNQIFNVKSVGNGYYTICAKHSNKYLDVDNAGKYDGANILQYTYNGGDNQKWFIKDAGNGSYYLISKCSGLHMDIEGGNMMNGTNVLTWSYNGGANQKFKFIPVSESQSAPKKTTGRSLEFKKLHPELKIGIDVSKYQDTIDWNAVKKDGIDYAMIRAGFRGYGENGSLNEDEKLDEFVKGARAAGLDVGIYFFSQAKNYNEGVEEANYTISLIKKYDITYPVAFDTEQSSSPTNTGRADNISVQDRTDAAKGFCSTIKAAGYETLIYASPSWIKDNLYLNQLSEYDIWLANYTGAEQEDPLKRPSNYKGKYVMWQYTDSGTVDGIKGKVDCDLYYYLR